MATSMRGLGLLGSVEDRRRNRLTMTQHADFKRLVRARMAKTGESYSTARAQLIRATGSSLTSALHVTNGDSTVDELHGTGLAERILVWRDALHEGPVPDTDPAELRRVRANFLSTPDPHVDEDAAAAEHADALQLLTTRDQTLEANSGGRYVLWFEADLYDQLQLAEILARLAGLDVPAERITLICIGEYPGIAHFGGLGELYADQLRTLPGSAGTRLSSEALELATQAWAAFRSRIPDRLGAISASLSTELRFLPEAFDRLSREYPSTRDGLSLTERRILAAVAEDANTAEKAFLASSRRESRPFLGDLWCFRRIAALANARSPLLWLDDAETSRQPRVQRSTRLGLTATGRRVLDGQVDHVALNGIDRWIGGVRLTGHRMAWRWDEGTERLVNANR
jgi:hypothetical protein